MRVKIIILSNIGTRPEFVLRDVLIDCIIAVHSDIYFINFKRIKYKMDCGDRIPNSICTEESDTSLSFAKELKHDLNNPEYETR